MNALIPKRSKINWQTLGWFAVAVFLLAWAFATLPNLGRLQETRAASTTFRAIEPLLKNNQFSEVYANITVGRVSLHGTVPTEADLIALTNLVAQNTPKNGVCCAVKVRVADAVGSPAR